jgi:hypothetical protein
MYTDNMRRAFRSITPPLNFKVELIDNDSFITIRADEVAFTKLGHDDKIEAVKYMIKVKKALEDQGAIVLLTRKAIK